MEYLRNNKLQFGQTTPYSKKYIPEGDKGRKNYEMSIYKHT